MWRHWRVLLIVFAVAGCGLPRDPENTSERLASTHELRVGATDNPDWVSADSVEPRGIEPTLVRRFASRIGAHILWSRGSETDLAEALKHHQLDIAIGGFDSKTPWKSIAGVSQPFAIGADKKKHVFLTAPGENRFLLMVDTFLAEQLRASKGQSA